MLLALSALVLSSWFQPGFSQMKAPPTVHGVHGGSYLQQLFGKVFSVVESFQVGDELRAGHPLPHVLQTWHSVRFSASLCPHRKTTTFLWLVRLLMSSITSQCLTLMCVNVSQSKIIVSKPKQIQIQHLANEMTKYGVPEDRFWSRATRSDLRFHGDPCSATWRHTSECGCCLWGRPARQVRQVIRQTGKQAGNRQTSTFRGQTVRVAEFVSPGEMGEDSLPLLSFSHQGKVGQKQPEQQTTQFMCLELMFQIPKLSWTSDASH